MKPPVLVDDPGVVLLVEPPVEVVPVGRLMIWPTWRVLGFTVGFAASRAEREMLRVAAMLVKVSPAWIVYVPPEADGVVMGEVGAVAGVVTGTEPDGTTIEAPI
jgi:hypothetical protein